MSVQDLYAKVTENIIREIEAGNRRGSSLGNQASAAASSR